MGQTKEHEYLRDTDMLIATLVRTGHSLHVLNVGFAGVATG
jgi:hypothetical protein